MADFRAITSCPACGATHAYHGTSSFFHRSELGVGAWFRVRDDRATGELDIVSSFERDVLRCDCGAWLLAVARFSLLDMRVASVRLHDARDIDLALEVDLAPSRDADGDSALPFARRAAHFHSRIDQILVRGQAPGTRAIGPTRCCSCGDARERQHELAPGLFPRAESLFLGGRVREPLAGAGTRRGAHVRLSDEPAKDFVCLTRPRRLGCPCSPRPSSGVLRFTRHAGELELVELELRVIATVDDVDDVDFAPSTIDGIASDAEADAIATILRGVRGTPF